MRRRRLTRVHQRAAGGDGGAVGSRRAGAPCLSGIAYAIGVDPHRARPLHSDSSIGALLAGTTMLPRSHRH